MFVNWLLDSIIDQRCSTITSCHSGATLGIPSTHDGCQDRWYSREARIVESSNSWSWTFGSKPEPAISCGDQIALASLLKKGHVLKQVDEADEQGLIPVPPVQWALNCNKFEALVQLACHRATIDLQKKRDLSHVLNSVGESYVHALPSLQLNNPSYAQLLMDHGVASTVNSVVDSVTSVILPVFKPLNITTVYNNQRNITIILS